MKTLIVLLTLVLVACTGTVAHRSRQLTCLGFCSDTGVEHTKSEATEPEPAKK